MMNEQEQQADYLERVKIAAPKVDAILKEHHLNLGAQFDSGLWPRALKAVPIYTDTKDYAAAAEPEPAPVTSPEQAAPVESPIQREDLDTGDTKN